ncbi:MAG: PrsW family glutamic-type intramembrane protease [Candidatus Paceibacterota bacterium]|jgi:RsiW-degrading membrane proteinase PrsW (M82 family)|nr:PrsW family intramembrane metalloprotease [Candidatus Paceibacterota bacterium]
MATHHHISIKKTGSVALAGIAITYLATQNPDHAMRLSGVLLGGILPALFWLWFWLKEDKAHPEPKKIIFESFVFGMIAVPFAVFFEKMTMDFIGEGAFVSMDWLFLFAMWAVIEETLKYGAAFIAGIRTKYFDEPIDVVMYMISSALGFAAFENILFIYNSSVIASSSMIPLRFIGASLLHVACSALIGFGIGFGVNRSTPVCIAWLVAGFASSFALHTAFNYFIMITEGKYLLNIFMILWVVMALIILLFEKIKRVPYYIAAYK